MRPMHPFFAAPNFAQSTFSFQLQSSFGPYTYLAISSAQSNAISFGTSRPANSSAQLRVSAWNSSESLATSLLLSASMRPMHPFFAAPNFAQSTFSFQLQSSFGPYTYFAISSAQSNAISFGTSRPA